MNDEESIWDEEVKQPRDFPYHWDGCQMASDSFSNVSLAQGYASQFVQGERWNWGGKIGENNAFLEFKPILKGSLTGRIFNKNDVCVAAFVFGEDGVIHPLDYTNKTMLESGTSAKTIKSGKLNEVTGELSLYCNIDEFDLLLDYEYEMGY